METREWKCQKNIDFVNVIANNTFYSIREYSGRGMFGKHCPAIACDDWSDVEEIIDLFGIANTAWDQLGLGYVVYPKTAGE